MKTNNMKKMLSITIAALLFISCSSCNKEENSAGDGSIEYTIDGKTYVQNDNINAVFIDGKFQGLTDDNLEAKVGDSEDISITVGTTYNGIKFWFYPDGIYYSSTAGSTSQNKITFTKNESNLLEGTFEGKVKLDGEIENPAKTITGKFTVRSFTRI